MKQGIEPERLLRIRMVDLSISGKKRLPAAEILMGAAEQCLREVKQCVSSPSVAKIDQAGELQAPVPAILGQHVSLLQVVMAKDRSIAVLQKVEAQLHILFQATRQGLFPPCSRNCRNAWSNAERMYSSLVGRGRNMIATPH